MCLKYSTFKEQFFFKITNLAFVNQKKKLSFKIVEKLHQPKNVRNVITIWYPRKELLLDLAIT